MQADPGFLTQRFINPAKVTITTADDLRLALTARGRAQVAVAEADRRPDITARGGIRLSREEEAVGFIAGISVPLPFFNPGRARVAQAQAEADRAAFAAEAQRREAVTRAERALANWRSAIRSLQLLDQQTIPAAQRLVTLTDRGFRLGALPFRDLADARTSLNNARRSRLDALEQVTLAKAALAEVTGAFSEFGLGS